ncbi:MAG TPA: hypothetical protein VGR16_07985 [Thermomicrobiales bacterium]|nr:hypothetical protein [Thermomicrobiales bacterium]
MTSGEQTGDRALTEVNGPERAAMMANESGWDAGAGVICVAVVAQGRSSIAQSRRHAAAGEIDAGGAVGGNPGPPRPGIERRGILY